MRQTEPISLLAQSFFGPLTFREIEHECYTVIARFIEADFLAIA